MRDIIKSIDFTRPRSEYFGDLIEKIFKQVPGNVVEIGGGYGENTQTFLFFAHYFGRQVLVIDPFEDGWNEMPESYRYNYDNFYRNTAGYPNLRLHKYSSQDPSCFEAIQKLIPIAFFFIDGLQTVEAVLSDLTLAEQCNAAVVCVDDANRLTGESQVPLALEQYKGKYQIITQNREAYLCL